MQCLRRNRSDIHSIHRYLCTPAAGAVSLAVADAKTETACGVDDRCGGAIGARPSTSCRRVLWLSRLTGVERTCILPLPLGVPVAYATVTDILERCLRAI